MNILKGLFSKITIRNFHRLMAMTPVLNQLEFFRIKTKAKKTYRHYELVKSEKAKLNSQIRFGVYVVYASSFSAKPLIDLMIDKPAVWDVKIVIVPDTSRGKEHQKTTYSKTQSYFIEMYGKAIILDGWNQDTGEFYDLTNEFDIIYYCNPYDSMVCRVHSIKYATTRDVLPVYFGYGYDAGLKTTMDRIRSEELSLVWKCYTETVFSYNDYCRFQPVKGKNVVLAGYSKMDNYRKYQEKTKERPFTILITPHHTVKDIMLPLSNFLDYYNLIIELPQKYPKIHFIFRPHPLLFTALINRKIWTEDEVNDYISAIKAEGVEYSTEGDYLDIFAKSDAIINDCASFSIEWLVTGKPGCFVLNKKFTKKYRTVLLEKAIESYTVAKCETDIIDFINSVIASPRKEYKMQDWVRKHVAVNYPHVAQFVEKDLRKSFLKKKNRA